MKQLSNFVPDFNQTKVKKKEIVKPVVLDELRPVKVEVGELSNAGLLDIKFSDRVSLP